MTHAQRLAAAKAALAVALKEWHMPSTKADWHCRWTRVIQAAEELRKAKADSAL